MSFMKRKQQCNQISQEELAKTQVLNLEDVHKIANYEKKTSKKPAILMAAVGLFSISMGLVYPSVIDLGTSLVEANRISSDNSSSSDTIILEDIERVTTCKYYSEKNADGTTGTCVYDLYFDENKQLQKYRMTFDIEPLSGNVNGLLVVQNLYNSYKAIDNLPLNGYIMNTTYTEKGMRSVADVNLKVLDLNQLTPQHKSNYFSVVPFTYGQNKEQLIAWLENNSYVCK